MERLRQALGPLSVTVGLGLLVMLVAISLAPWKSNPPTAGREEEQLTSPISGMGVLVGRVMRGPVSSVEHVDGRISPAPARNIRMMISTEAGEAVGSWSTGPDGLYRIDLPSGTYLVSIASLGEGEYTKDLPAITAVSAGQETRLDVRIDTGIR